MQDLIFDNLPLPPSGRNGWPWGEKPSLLTTSRSWPRISVVTPSYNQGCYIEETIRSVLLQGYPNLEYIVMDGGSDDGTIEIIRKYKNWLSYWQSNSDEGQADALNKGFSRATGEIFAYINSDDLFEPGAFAHASRILTENSASFVAGACTIFNESGVVRIFEPHWPDSLSHFLTPFGSTFAQPASFWTKKAYEAAGGFDSGLHYAFDREFFLKLGLCGVKPLLVDRVLARYRDHEQTKTRNTIKFYEEAIPIIQKYGHKCDLSDSDIGRHLCRVQNDIEYLRIFQVWRDKGRKAALLRFIRWTAMSPTFLMDRKVLGQARRLFMFKEKDVAELKRSKL